VGPIAGRARGWDRRGLVQSLTVWTFQGADTAVRTLPLVQRLVVDGAVAVEDAAIVSCTDDAPAPAIHPVGTLTGPGRLWSGFWGMLLAVVFLVPAAAPSLGAAAGAFAGSLASFGVPDDFLLRVRASVTPGRSALFVLSPADSADRLVDALEDGSLPVIRSDLSPEQQRRLYELLGAVATVRH
jgi:uncharacterized membrane protein